MCLPAVLADPARREAILFIAEAVRLRFISLDSQVATTGSLAYGEDVDNAKDAVEDAGTDHAAPHWRSQAFLGGCLLVEVTKDGDTEDDHDHSKGHKAVRWREKRPIRGNEPSKKIHL